MNIFTRLMKPTRSDVSTWHRSLSETGIQIHKESRSGADPISFATLNGLLAQMMDDGLVKDGEQDDYILTWDSYYEAILLPGYSDLSQALELPNTTSLKPNLSSRNALTDIDFSITLATWKESNGRSVSPNYVGPVLKVGGKLELMTSAQWDLFKRVTAFAKRNKEERTEHLQRQSWGQIRRTAVSSGAQMSDFLVKTVVLTPDRLDISFRKSDIAVDDTVVEVIPGFEGAPSSWLQQFDRVGTVQDRYDLATEDGGLVQIVLSPQVKAVLQQIKHFDNRRLAGSRAQAFLLNPFSAFGEAACDVIDEGQFEKAKEEAGIEFERFTPVVERNILGIPERIGILIESASSAGLTGSTTHFLDESDLTEFIFGVEQAIARGFQLAFWQGNELEILGDTPSHLEELKTAQKQRTRPRTLVQQPPPVIQQAVKSALRLSRPNQDLASSFCHQLLLALASIFKLPTTLFIRHYWKPKNTFMIIVLKYYL